MSHTKRTPDFQALVMDLAERIESTAKISLHEAQLIAAILRENTTDIACVVKAADDEPLFCLRGQDILAADLVSKWADHADSGLTNGMKISKEKILDARVCAQGMRTYLGRRFPT